MQIKENTSIHPGKISLGVGRYVYLVPVTTGRGITTVQTCEESYRVPTKMAQLSISLLLLLTQEIFSQPKKLILALVIMIVLHSHCELALM